MNITSWSRPARTILAAAMLASAPAAALAAQPVERAVDRDVFGFFSPSARAYMLDVADYSVLSTVAFFSIEARADGHLNTTASDGSANSEWAAWNSSWMGEVIAKAHAAGAEVVLSIRRFAWSSPDAATTVALLENADARATIAAEIADAVVDRGADGANLDFEPIPLAVKDEYVTFVRQVRAALDARQAGLQLTFDATGGIHGYDVTALTAPGAADAVFIMGYPFNGSFSERAGATSPLAGPGYDLTDSLNRFLNMTSADKIILGVPYYGYEWSTETKYRHSIVRPPSADYGTSRSRRIVEAIPLGKLHGVRWDSEQQVPWTRWRYRACADCPTTWRQLYYENRRSLGLKYDLVNGRDLRGVGFWAWGFEGDRPGLYGLLREKFGTP